MSSPSSLAVLRWFDRHGRKSLPWQHAKNPYRVWISEIMLQQTQVATVIGYYQNFMVRFPDVQTLAAAPLDEVLALWAGLGYYSRARNLHAAAKYVVAHFAGAFPKTVAEMIELPGIGRSTAGAILSLGSDLRAPILDGNVKRVLCRVAGISLHEDVRRNEQRLWQLADELTPTTRVADYNQAMMDIGATVCTRGMPNCAMCPFNLSCVARAEQNFSAYPGSKPAKVLPEKSTRMLVLLNCRDEVLLQQRPPSGIWGGLWVLPEVPELLSPGEFAEQFGNATGLRALLPLRHTFSHFHLDIHTFAGVMRGNGSRIMDSPWRWQPMTNLKAVGLPAPIQRLLTQIASESKSI